MRVQTRSDVRLVMRGVNNGWDIPAEQRKLIIDSLVEMVQTKDPKLMESAIDLLRKLDEVNVKREAIQARELDGGNADERIRLLELAQRIPAAELARLASDNGITVDGQAKRRADSAAGADGEKTGE